jgi:adenosylcobyric acid synthase
MSARAVMVCGTTSGAGKSLLATALARWYARQGLKVAPFKAQNMSNNARVAAGGEMGSAQYFQAIAARAVPDVRMNPVLLKPEKDTRSQVILLGRRRDDLSALEWRARSREVWPVVKSCLEDLMSGHDVVVIEGAGSPTEINLQSSDVVNMRIAEAARAATLLVCDIDRGGAFAHLYGTFQLLPPEHRALIRGFVLNKFRGDRDLLAPGPQKLEELTGVPTLGVLPLWREHGLPEEDGVFDASPSGSGLSVVVVAGPYISNLDEFQPLRRIPGISLRFARDRHTVESADLLILPGSKHVAADLAWLRERELDSAVAAHVAADKPTLAICGGLQMLGGEIKDPDGVEGEARGLGLLPYTTEFLPEKQYRHGRYTLGPLQGFWAPLSGTPFEGYEIHHGVSRPVGERRTGGGRAPAEGTATSAAPVGSSVRALQPVLSEAGGWQSGAVLALYPHGLFENTQIIQSLFGRDAPTLETTLEGLADFVEAHLTAGTLRSLLT